MTYNKQLIFAAQIRQRRLTSSAYLRWPADDFFVLRTIDKRFRITLFFFIFTMNMEYLKWKKRKKG